MTRPPVRVHVSVGRRAFPALRIAVAAALLACFAGCLLPSSQASAQGVGSLLHFPQRPTPTPPPAQPPDAPMLVQA
ncbi:MAG TPA: hypothetical protein VN938_11085, partial [Xanthobacteraceae bacterium]|nr:hypothetical protein [Xanthobacteraceae bacterium]